MDQEKKVAVVTGGVSTIGEAISLQLAKDGFIVCVLDDDAKKGEELVVKIKEISEGAFFQFDKMDSPNDAPKAMEQVYKKYGRIDALVNAAEMQFKCPALDIKSEMFDKVLNANTKCCLFSSIAAATYMKENEEGGNIVNLTSILDRIAIGEHALFGASKAAIAALTKELAVDLSPYKIKVNALASWAVDTPEFAAELTEPGEREKIMSTLLLDRMLTPEDVSELVSFLVSEDSYCLNGFDMALDAGMTTFRIRPEHSYFDEAGKNYYN